ncbi:metallophosphoesterase [Candidatus Obscuribacterales bacterium]|nr:metallophosphoesterase [Candidatus Obscuribacterales bacterium]MBX3149087.1 metallophosphoesterase [Candidatus Obscuribacterales bacterium]
MSSTFKFLQLSDVHLDSPQNRGVLSYSSAQRAARYTDLVESLVGAMRVASDQKVDAVLIPGGLWDHRSIRGETAGTVLEAIAELNDIPVFITPGEGDPYTIDSYYHPTFLAARGMRSWPKNAFVFNSPEFTTFKHPSRDDIAITGYAHLSSRKISDRLLGSYVNRDDNVTFNILLFHGSLDSYPGIDGHADRITAPFSVEELAAQRFNYTALGHFHEYTELCDENDQVIGAYSGCLSGRNFDELGPRVAMLGTVTVDDNGQSSTLLEPIEVASNRLTYLPVDVSGLDAEGIKAEIEYGVQELEIRPDVDIVCISLEGTHTPDVEPYSIAQKLRPDFYHLLIVDRTRPDYLAEEYDPRTTEYKYLESMLEKQRQAEAKRAENPNADTLNNVPGFLMSAKTIEDALYYGLDALKRQKVTHRHVD